MHYILIAIASYIYMQGTRALFLWSIYIHVQLYIAKAVHAAVLK